MRTKNGASTCTGSDQDFWQLKTNKEQYDRSYDTRLVKCGLSFFFFWTNQVQMGSRIEWVQSRLVHITID